MVCANLHCYVATFTLVHLVPLLAVGDGGFNTQAKTIRHYVTNTNKNEVLTHVTHHTNQCKHAEMYTCIYRIS